METLLIGSHLHTYNSANIVGLVGLLVLIVLLRWQQLKFDTELYACGLSVSQLLYRLPLYFVLARPYHRLLLVSIAIEGLRHHG
jgi:hypothetical protein